MPSFAPHTLTAFVTRLFAAGGSLTLNRRPSLGAWWTPTCVARLARRDARPPVRRFPGTGRTGRCPAQVVSETPAVVVCDGQWGLGQVQAHRLLDLILPSAKVLGLAAGTGRELRPHRPPGRVRRSGPPRRVWS